jgi:hypothetical protein
MTVMMNYASVHFGLQCPILSTKQAQCQPGVPLITSLMLEMSLLFARQMSRLT